MPPETSSHTERSESDPYTMEMRLCDGAGMVSHERHPSASNPDGGATYLEMLNWLKPPDRQYTGEPFECTGSAHLGGKHIRCTSPAHVPCPAPGATYGVPLGVRAEDFPSSGQREEPDA